MARAQQAMRPLDLVELVGRARAKALAFCPLMKMVLTIVGGRGNSPALGVRRGRPRLAARCLRGSRYEMTV